MRILCVRNIGKIYAVQPRALWSFLFHHFADLPVVALCEDFRYCVQFSNKKKIVIKGDKFAVFQIHHFRFSYVSTAFALCSIWHCLLFDMEIRGTMEAINMLNINMTILLMIVEWKAKLGSLWHKAVTFGLFLLLNLPCDLDCETCNHYTSSLSKSFLCKSYTLTRNN